MSITKHRGGKRDSTPCFFPSSSFFSSIFFFFLSPALLLPFLLLLQKFRLPGKSWDPIIRVSSIVMQITITNRRQGRSPDDIAGKESPWIPSTRGRILSLSLFYLAPWEPSRISFSRIEEARKRWWQGCWWSTGRSTSSTRVLLNGLQLTIKILVTSSSPLCARLGHLHRCFL